MEEAWELAAVSEGRTPREKPTTSSKNGMTIIGFPERVLKIVEVSVSEDFLTVELNDGRILSTPLKWYPRLKKAPQAFRDNWKITGFGQGVSWEDVNEDINLNGMLAGMGGTRSELLSWERRDEEGCYFLKPDRIIA